MKKTGLVKSVTFNVVYFILGYKCEEVSFNVMQKIVIKNGFSFFDP